jgi:hypothetical protein
MSLYGSAQTSLRVDCSDSISCRVHETGASVLCRLYSLLLLPKVAEVYPGASFPASVSYKNYACSYTPSPCLLLAEACKRQSCLASGSAPCGRLAAVLFSHPGFRVPFAEYYACIRLPHRCLSASFSVVRKNPCRRTRQQGTSMGLPSSRHFSPYVPRAVTPAGL